MKVLITSAQAKILLHRLSVSDAIADCLTDEGSPLENVAFEDVQNVGEALAVRCESIMERKGGKGALSFDLLNQRIANEVLRDAVDGSTWAYCMQDMVDGGEMTKQQASAQRAIMRSLERKLQSAGMEDVKFPR